MRIAEPVSAPATATGRAFASNRRHLDDAPILVDRDDRDDRGLGEEDVVERAVGIGQYLAGQAFDAFEIGRETLELARRQRGEQPIMRCGRKDDHPLVRQRSAQSSQNDPRTYRSGSHGASQCCCFAPSAPPLHGKAS